MQPSPLDALEDVIIPSSVPWWPLSISMWALIITVGLILIAIIMFTIRSIRFKKAKKEAIKQASLLAEQPLQLHILIKRLAKHYYGVEQAALSQQAWLDNLQAMSGEVFSLEELNSLYSQSNEPNLSEKLTNAIRKFKVKGAVHV